MLFSDFGNEIAGRQWKDFKPTLDSVYKYVKKIVKIKKVSKITQMRIQSLSLLFHGVFMFCLSP